MEKDVWELSTQLVMQEAEKRGLQVEILDQQENFIRLTGFGRTALIKEATKTSLDSYITFLAMENKGVSKILLQEQGLPVAPGRSFLTADAALRAYGAYENQAVVLKPNKTNFGIGVSLILPGEEHKERYAAAVREAFVHDSTILLEEFIPGREYRFLVIGDETAAVLRRLPANVTGDGQHTIEELVAMKNASPLRGKGYTKPLEEIRLGEEETAYLFRQGLTVHDRPEKDMTVYLRENSNISTGGDSVDETDRMPSFYKEQAVKAARAAGAAICGVDMIIEDKERDPEKTRYAIIEINFNPALHIHAYPWKGKNREPEKKVLDLLGFKLKSEVP